jgi:hypothetical protein
VSPTPDQRTIDQLVARLSSPRRDKVEGNGWGTEEGTSALTDQALLEILFAERDKGVQWRDTHSGHYEPYYPSPSEAVAGLLWKFAFYSRKDRAQMERLIRGSGLASPKFDERRGGTTWILDEIEDAIAAAHEIYTPKVVSAPPSPLTIKEDGDGGDDDGGAPVVWFADLEKPQAREFLVTDAVPRNYPAVMHGWSGTAKSILALLLAMALSGRWKDWLGLEVHTHGKVLYLDFELDADEQLRRVHALAAGMGVSVPQDLAYLSALGIRTPDAFRHAIEFCRAHDAVMVVIDSLGPAMLGDMEAAKDVIKFHNDYIAPFRAIGVTPLIIDHQGKLQAGENYQQKTAFGSAYKEHLARSVFQVEAGNRDRDNGVLDVRVRHRKSNFGARLDPFDVRLEFGIEKITAAPVKLDDADLATETSLNAKDRVLKALKAGPAYPDELAERTGLAHGTVVNCLTQLKRAGKVNTTGEKKGRAEEVEVTPPPLVYISNGGGGDRAGEDEQRIRKLVREGMSEAKAREAVLGTCDHGTPKGYPCDDCDIEKRFGGTE